MTPFALLALAACGPISFELPPKDDTPDTGVPDTDADTDADADTDVDTDTDSDTPGVPAVCAPASWSWDGENTVATADASFVGVHPQSAANVPAAPGDMDGDGLGDLVIGAPAQDDDAGAVYFVLGGVERTRSQPLAGRPSLLGVAGEMLSDVAPLGDLDGDGLADVGLPGAYEYLVRGRTSGWPVGGAAAVETDARIRGDVDTFSSFGDMDGDGLDDWLLYGWNVGGEIYVVRDADALGDTTAAVAGSTWLYGEPDHVNRYGGGDLDGDGRGDLIVSHADWRELSVLFGPDMAGVYGAQFPDVAGVVVHREVPFEFEVLEDLDGNGADELAVVVSEPPDQRGVRFFLGRAGWNGMFVLDDADVDIGRGEYLLEPTSLGDLNGDGFPELGVMHDPTASGAGPWNAYIFLGRATWPAELSLADADVHITSDSLSSEIMWFPTPAMRGDIDGDGIDDLLLRIPREDEGGLDRAGRVSVYLGRSTWPSELGAADADVTFVGDVLYQGVGQRLVVEDVDGDGCDDLVTGSPYHPVATQEGETFVHFGQNR